MDNERIQEERGLSKHRVVMLVGLGCFFVGAFLGWIGATLLAQQSSPEISALRESDISTTSEAGYSFIDPLISIRGTNNSAPYTSIETQVASYIAGQQSNGLVSASVDFRDINVPGGFVLNPSTEYTPASLNKVPLMMAYYKLAESNPAILSIEIEYPGTSDADSTETIESPEQLTPGATYTVEELIEHMIRYSDNNATDLLKDYLNSTNQATAYTNVFNELGVDSSTINEYADTMTVGEYSTFLRALYNATYLNWDYSERALELLSETDFSEGIESGVPNNVLVSQKFGEVKLVDGSGALVGRELNNCGIIYYPNHPYLLCIMMTAKGDNIKALESDLESISQIVYSGMQKIYP